MDVNYELFKIFYTVATEKSISKGAEKLMISQPAVTQAIKNLEDQLGGKVFIRTPKGVLLTNEGKELLKYISEGINYFNNGINKFMSLKNLDNGVINIGATTTISENYLIPYLKEFHNLYPNIEINISNNLTDNNLKDLRNGNLDIVIMAIPDNDLKDLEVNYICDLHDIFVTNKVLEKQSINDLLNNKILLQKYPSVTRINFNRFLIDNNLECKYSMEVVSHSLLVKLTENGFGISLLTKEFITDKLNDTLFEIKTDLNIPKRRLGFATKKGIIKTFTTKKFIELLNKK